MTHNRYLVTIAGAGVVSWIAWILVLIKMDPRESTELALAMFFISLFFATVCTFTVLGFYFRVWLNKNEIYYNHINIAFRQGILLTLITLGCLIFQLLSILTWWSGLLCIAAVSLIEFYFMAKDKE